MLQKSSARKIIRVGTRLKTADGDSRDANSFMLDTLGPDARIPKGQYQVTYVVIPQRNAKLRVSNAGTGVYSTNNTHCFAVCWLHSDLRGQHVRREVRLS